MRTLLGAFSGLPRVLGMVWNTQPWLTGAMGGITIVRGFAPAATAWTTKLVIDAVTQAMPPHHGTVQRVFWLVGLQFALASSSSLLGTLSNIVQQLLQEQVSNRVRLLVMEQANRLDLQFFERPEFYDKLRQAQEQAAFRPVNMVSQSFGLLRTVITFLSMVALLSRLEWWIAVIALGVPIPAFIADTKYGWMGYQRMRRQSPERRQMSYFETVMTTDTYNKEVKLFNLGSFFIDRFRHLAARFYRENRSLLVQRYLQNWFWLSLSLAVNAAIYLYVALQTVAGRITLGDLTLYTGAALTVGSSFQDILSGVSSTYEHNLFIGTLFEFLGYKPLIQTPDQPASLVAETGMAKTGLEVEFRDVSFTYPGLTTPALRRVSFRMEAGESLALVGRNGAGKTTVIKLLSRLYDPDEGQILIGGRDIREYDVDEFRSQIGVIFQDYVTYFMTAQANIGIGHLAEMDDLERVQAAAAKSGAEQVISKLQDGYQTMLGRWFDEGTQLSGGEWQKVALARAFMRDARVLVLDEPTSALDARAEAEVFTQFRTLTKGKTAIFISHRFSTVRMADRIVVIEDGTVIQEGSHEALMLVDGRYAELFNLQADAYR
ncbi:MAG: ABC transporter ATP-binding protein [Herpetosiphon sp.]